MTFVGLSDSLWQAGSQLVVVVVIVVFWWAFSCFQLALFDQSGKAKLWRLNKVIKIGFKASKLWQKCIELSILILYY